MIVGGGVIGLTCAWELARLGHQVTVLDQQEMGREASWAGAGMIPPGDLKNDVANELAQLSSELWPTLSAQLRDTTGIDNGYTPCQGLLLPHEEKLEQEFADWQERGVRIQHLDSQELKQLVPVLSENHLNGGNRSGLLLPDQAQVRNPRHMKALVAACRHAGVQLLEQHQVTGWETSENRIQSVVTNHGHFSAGEFIVTAGAWSDLVVAPLNHRLNVRPIRGQIVLFHASEPLFRQTIECGTRYLVPRIDGRILVGATEEHVGYVKENTPEAVASLCTFARDLIPALSEVPVEMTWAGLRPYREDVPAVGRSERWGNLILAAGHFRAGLSNSPATALIVRQILSGESPAIDMQQFAFA